MSDVKRYEAVHLRYDDNNIRYGEGCEVEVVLASDYAALEAELARLRAGQEPVLYVNGEHLALMLDNPDKEGRSASASTVKGHYCDTPLYTAPAQPAAHDQDEVQRLREALSRIRDHAARIMDDEVFYEADSALVLAAVPSAPATAQGDAVRASLSADNQRITPPEPIIARPHPLAGIATVRGVNAQLLEALENTATWIEQLPVPTVGAAGQLVKIDKAIAAAREGGKV